MVSQGEREIMGLMLKTNAELVGDVLRRTEDSEAPSVMAAIAATRALDIIVEDTLHALVREARKEGRTWAEIGEVLRVTRQAAFQRFGSGPEEDDTGELAEPVPGAGAEAIRILELCLGRQWDEVLTTFDARMRQAAPVELLEAAVDNVRSLVGGFVSAGPPSCEAVGDYTVVEAILTFERGDIRGQVAFNGAREVAGLFLLPVEPGTPVPGECEGGHVR